MKKDKLGIFYKIKNKNSLKTFFFDRFNQRQRSLNITTNPIYNKLQFLNPKKKQFGEDLLQILQNDETLIVKLKMFILEIEDETKQLRQSGSFWNCIPCNTILKEGFNEETCIFHPGQLKYFSCKTCGGDEYFTCCNQC